MINEELRKIYSVSLLTSAHKLNILKRAVEIVSLLPYMKK